MTWSLFLSLWSWDVSVILGTAALLAVYLAAVRFRFNTKTVFFISGVLVMFIALESPLDSLGDTYLFSAHMLQHLLLILVASPLMLFGLPDWLVQRILAWPLADHLERVLSRPVIAWLIATVTLWGWHVPTLYNAALDNESIHALEHLSFLVTATIFWWPVLIPIRERQMAPLVSVLYLFAAGASNSILGILLTYTKPGLYPTYVHPVDEFGILSLIRQGWGLTPTADQELGGLIMWVPGGLIYVLAAMGGLGRWYSMPDDNENIDNLQNTNQENIIQSSSLEEV